MELIYNSQSTYLNKIEQHLIIFYLFLLTSFNIQDTSPVSFRHHFFLSLNIFTNMIYSDLWTHLESLGSILGGCCDSNLACTEYYYSSSPFPLVILCCPYIII